MKRTLTIVFGLASVFAFGQSVDRQVLSPQGNSVKTNNFIVSQTVGEMIIGSADSPRFYVTQGFQQGNLGATSLKENVELSFDATAYPNPTTERVSLQINSDRRETLSISILNMEGQEIAPSIESLRINGIHRQDLDFSSFASGNYIIRITDADGKSGSIQIIKN